MVDSFNTFELSVASGPSALYANGNQQLLFKLKASKRDSTGATVSLSQKEIESLRIALDTYTYDKSKPGDLNQDILKMNMHSNLGHYGIWVASLESNGFEFYPSSTNEYLDEASVAERAKNPQANEYFIYVSCLEKETPVVSLCAFIECDDGYIYCTNKKKWAITDGKESNTAFDYKLDVSVLTPPQLAEENITVNPEGSESEDGFYDIAYPFKITYPNNSVVAQKSISVTPAGMIQWEYPDPGVYQASYTGYAPPKATAYIFDPSIPTGPQTVPIPKKRDSQAALVLVSRNTIAYEPGHSRGPCIIAITDVYGNTHNLICQFLSSTGKGRDQLVIKVV